jgi:Response regulator receiver domain./Bacterial regulatory helix-turn-helix proteins, AraC family.
MIKVMIIDDEHIIRTGIRTSIDWNSYGMAVVGEASNGKEALEKALEVKPDIAIVDIRMPVMDGLEFTRLIKEKMPDMRIIIVSGYDDFTYAKEALRLGVNDYLLKPIGADELINLTKKLCKEIIEERREQDTEKTLKNIFTENLPYLQSHLINSIIKGEYIDENFIHQKMDELQMKLSGRFFEVAIIDIDDFYLITENLSDLEKEKLRASVKIIADDVLKSWTNSGGVYFSEFDFLIAVINVKKSGRKELHQLYSKIKNEIRDRLNLTVTIGVSDMCSGILNLSEAYNKALTALRSKVFKGKNKVLYYEDSKRQNPLPVIYPSEDEKELLDSLKTMKIDKINSVIEKICTNLSNHAADEKEVKNICLRLIIIATSVLETLGVNYRKNSVIDFDPYREIEKYETIADIEAWLKQIFSNFVDALQNYKNEKYSGIAKIAIQYIEENYFKDINVQQLAAVTCVTPNYFSRVFKRETGKSFTEWLNTVRIEMAKMYLKDPKLRIYEVADKVGYNDYKIFNFNFKKYAGCTPKEYRENI